MFYDKSNNSPRRYKNPETSFYSYILFLCAKQYGFENKEKTKTDTKTENMNDVMIKLELLDF